jgi:hypothetical protein
MSFVRLLLQIFFSQFSVNEFSTATPVYNSDLVMEDGPSETGYSNQCYSLSPLSPFIDEHNIRYFPAALRFAHRAFCAAAILRRLFRENLRFPAPSFVPSPAT